MTDATRLFAGLAIQLALVLLPGLAFTVRMRRIDLTVIACGSGLVAFASFFATWASPELGRAWTYSVLTVSALAIAGAFPAAVDRREVSRALRSNIALPLALTLGMGWVVLGSLALHGGYGLLNTIAGHRYVAALPIDNLMPELLADRLIAGEPVKPFVAEWLSSDRPPLQSGFTTFVRPVRIGIDRDSQYQVLGTGLQLLVLPALWLLLRRLRVPPGVAVASTVVVACSGLSILHSAYVWPKLLSSAFVLFAAAEVLAPPSRWRAPLVGACSALALLAHGSAVFALVVVGVVVVARFGFTRELVATAGVAIALTMPWSAYQRWVDPPGNRLFKWHLAGVEQIDGRSTWHAISDQYGALSFADVAHLKRENFSFLYNHARVTADAFPVTGPIDRVRLREFVHIANALGVGWLAVPFVLAAMVRARWRRRAMATVGSVLSAASLVGIGVWCVVMFGPATTLVHAGSLALPIVLVAGLVVWASAVHPVVAGLLAALAVIRVVRVWLLAASPADAGLGTAVSKGAVGLMIVGGCVLAATAWRLCTAGDPTSA